MIPPQTAIFQWEDVVYEYVYCSLRKSSSSLRFLRLAASRSRERIAESSITSTAGSSPVPSPPSWESREQARRLSSTFSPLALPWESSPVKCSSMDNSATTRSSARRVSSSFFPPFRAV